jgi:F0F1-type ATP synthase assembly protein I
VSENKMNVKGLLIATNFAFEAMILVGLFTLAGYFLDKWLGTVFIFTLLFILIGVFAGVYNIIKKINKVEEKDGK